MVYWRVTFNDGETGTGWLELDDARLALGLYYDDGTECGDEVKGYYPTDTDVAQADWPEWAKVKNNVA